MKLKKDDRVKIVQNGDTYNRFYDKYIGETTTILSITSGHYILPLQNEGGDQKTSLWEDNEVELVARIKNWRDIL